MTTASPGVASITPNSVQNRNPPCCNTTSISPSAL